MSTAASAPAKRKEAPQQSDAATVIDNRRITLSPQQKDAISSPYEARQEEFSQIHKQRSADTGEEYVIAAICDPLGELSDERLEQILDGGKDRDDLDELDSAELKIALQKMTQKEVDDFVRAMIVPVKLFELKHTLSESILYADSRNDPGNGFLMLNTHSTWCSTLFLCVFVHSFDDTILQELTYYSFLFFPSVWRD
jgi:hypothetical protein